MASLLASGAERCTQGAQHPELGLAALGMGSSTSQESNPLGISSAWCPSVLL